MSVPLAHAAPAVDQLAANGVINDSGISDFLSHNIANLAILAVGIMLLIRAHNKDHRGAMTTGGIVLIALCVMGLASGNHATNVGNALTNLVFGS